MTNDYKTILAELKRTDTPFYKNPWDKNYKKFIITELTKSECVFALNKITKANRYYCSGCKSIEYINLAIDIISYMNKTYGNKFDVKLGKILSISYYIDKNSVLTIPNDSGTICHFIDYLIANNILYDEKFISKNKVLEFIYTCENSIPSYILFELVNHNFIKVDKIIAASAMGAFMDRIKSGLNNEKFIKLLLYILKTYNSQDIIDDYLKDNLSDTKLFESEYDDKEIQDVVDRILILLNNNIIKEFPEKIYYLAMLFGTDAQKEKLSHYFKLERI
jgi:hypothetical protein